MSRGTKYWQVVYDTHTNSIANTHAQVHTYNTDNMKDIRFNMSDRQMLFLTNNMTVGIPDIFYNMSKQPSKVVYEHSMIRRMCKNLLKFDL